MREMSDDERRAFLLHGTRTGHLATTRADGRPHVAPIWFLLDGDDVVFNTRKESLKGRCLVRDPRASLSVDDALPPFSFVVVHGTVELNDDPVEKLRWATAIGGRYMGEDQASTYGQRNAQDDEWLCRLRPVSVVAQADIAGW